MCDDDLATGPTDSPDAGALTGSTAIVRATDFDLVVTSPGSRRPIRCCGRGRRRRVPSGDVELAWRPRRRGPLRSAAALAGGDGPMARPPPPRWIRHARRRRRPPACCAANIWRTRARRAGPQSDVLAVGCQLPAVLGAVAAPGGPVRCSKHRRDHLDWHGGFGASPQPRRRRWRGGWPWWASTIPQQRHCCRGPDGQVGFRHRPAARTQRARRGAVDRAFSDDLVLAGPPGIPVARTGQEPSTRSGAAALAAPSTMPPDAIATALNFRVGPAPRRRSARSAASPVDDSKAATRTRRRRRSAIRVGLGGPAAACSRAPPSGTPWPGSRAGWPAPS